jgi:hypothetical protein
MRNPALLAMLLAACGGDAVTSPATPTVKVGEEFTLAPGQTASISDAGWRVKFEKVANDSRCPVDATCVWEGDATAEVVVTPGGASPTTVELHTQRMRAREAKVGDLYLRLVSLVPVGRSTAPVAPADYRATFVASRTPQPGPAGGPTTTH